MHYVPPPPCPTTSVGAPSAGITTSVGSNSSMSTVRTWVTLPPVGVGFHPLNAGNRNNQRPSVPGNEYKYAGRGAGSIGLIKRPQSPNWYYYAIGGFIWACLVAFLLFLMVGFSWFAWHKRFPKVAPSGTMTGALIGGSRLYDCAFGSDYNATMKWHPEKATWCCKYHGCACRKDSARWKSGDSPPKSCKVREYDCAVGRVRDWNYEKRFTCCRKYGCGCQVSQPQPQPKLLLPPCRDGLVDVEVNGQWVHPAPTCEYPNAGPPGIEAPPNPRTGEWTPVTYHRCQCPTGKVYDRNGECIPLVQCPDEQYCQTHG